MRKTIKCSLVLMLTLVLTGAGKLSASDFKKAYHGMIEHYATMKLFHADFKMEVFGTASDQRPGSVRKGSIQKQNDDVLMKLGQITTLINSEVYLVKNSSEKEISFSLRDSSQVTEPFVFNEEQTDSMLQTADSIVFLQKKGNVESYAIYNGKNLINKMIMHINTQNNALVKLEYYYMKKPQLGYEKISISYSNISFTSGVNQSELKSEYYIRVNGSQISPTARFNDYEIVFINLEGNEYNF